MALLAGAVVLVVRVAYTPTVEVPVLNDTAAPVTLAVCASDVPTLEPGQRTILAPNVGDARAACYVYSGFDANAKSSSPDHCLALPTINITPDTLVRVSSATPLVNGRTCGD